MSTAHRITYRCDCGHEQRTIVHGSDTASCERVIVMTANGGPLPGMPWAVFPRSLCVWKDVEDSQPCGAPVTATFEAFESEEPEPPPGTTTMRLET